MRETKTSFKMGFFPIVFQNFWHKNQYTFIFFWGGGGGVGAFHKGKIKINF